MNIIDVYIKTDSKQDKFYIYPIGDCHVGASNCAETHLKNFIGYIEKKPNAYWFGGGDLCDCITPMDSKRYDIRSLPDWLFSGKAMNIKEQLIDIVRQERERFCEFVAPIKDKCIGLMEGNHEFEIMKRANNGHHYLMCEGLGVPNLTDCVFIRFRFGGNNKGGVTVVIFAMHGHGGGRTPGAEPNHLNRLGQIVDAEIILRGHSHIFRIEPSEPRLYVPKKGAIPDECCQREIFKGNWGCWLKSYARGSSTYDSRAAYPPRPLKAMEIMIKPRHNYSTYVSGRRVIQTRPLITMNECPFE